MRIVFLLNDDADRFFAEQGDQRSNEQGLQESTQVSSNGDIRSIGAQRADILQGRTVGLGVENRHCQVEASSRF